MPQVPTPIGSSHQLSKYAYHVQGVGLKRIASIPTSQTPNPKEGIEAALQPTLSCCQCPQLPPTSLTLPGGFQHTHMLNIVTSTVVHSNP
jgi:hypothetical protein